MSFHLPNFSPPSFWCKHSQMCVKTVTRLYPPHPPSPPAWISATYWKGVDLPFVAQGGVWCDLRPQRRDPTRLWCLSAVTWARQRCVIWLGVAAVVVAVGVVGCGDIMEVQRNADWGQTTDNSWWLPAQGLRFWGVYFMDFEGIVPTTNVIFGWNIPFKGQAKHGSRKRINTNTHTYRVSLRLSVKLFTDGT